ncbi:Redox-sensing transcriptional repressor Rex [compost metagenome]
MDIGVICVPKNNAQKVCDKLVQGGVKGIWNFAPIDLDAPEDITIENVHLSESVLTLIYLLNEKDQ